MGSISVKSLRSQYPGKSDTEIAAHVAEEYGYIVVLRYKSRGAPDYTDFAVCKLAKEVEGYFNSPYCSDVEILFDIRSRALKITPALLLQSKCRLCDRPATQQSLVIGDGNDFYFCPVCATMFCQVCILNLPLMGHPYGYAKCPDCDVQLQRAFPGAIGNRPLRERQDAREMTTERDDTTGFFVFDYSAMDGYYGKHAFDAIYEALRSSSGVCAFYDGDIFNCETVREIAKLANLVTPSGLKSPLANLNSPFDFGAYFAAMWTDTYSNFKKAHDALVSLPGYLGYMMLRGKHKFQDAQHLFGKQLHLTPSIALKDGSIIKGTSKYSIGFSSADEALLRAAELGEVEAARKAIADGADVNCIDPNDRVATPIVHAACNGHVEIVKLLLQKGADPNARNVGSNTALMLAARFGHIEVVKALIAGGADVNARDRTGGTALENAQEHPDVQRILRQAGAQ